MDQDFYRLAELRGEYNFQHFVVRLRADLFRALNELSDGSRSALDHDSTTMSAFASYFHETLHWWQLIGTTSGLLLSCASPAKMHASLRHLRSLLAQIGPKKSLLSLERLAYGQLPAEAAHHLNIILNNWHDLEFNRQILLNPLRIQTITSNPYFDCVGHSLFIGLANTVLMLAATVDPEFEVLPNVKPWEEGSSDMRSRKVDGFYFGSPIGIPPIGALHIFEGQARFSQMQYLFLATGGTQSWDDFRKMGMLTEVYTKAFELFLDLIREAWPPTPTSPDVNLFLLVCDLALNPSDGYPFDLRHFESFIISDDPGHRFCWFCGQLRKNKHFRIQRCSKDEYTEISTVLCRSLGCATPVEISRELASWPSRS